MPPFLTIAFRSDVESLLIAGNFNPCLVVLLQVGLKYICIDRFLWQKAIPTKDARAVEELLSQVCGGEIAHLPLGVSTFQPFCRERTQIASMMVGCRRFLLL